MPRLVLSGILAVAAVVSFVVFALDFSEYRRCESMLTTVGDVSSSDVFAVPDKLAEGMRYTYRPVVRFEYVARGKIHSGELDILDDRALFTDPLEAVSALDRYGEGSAIEIRYLPESPDVAEYDTPRSASFFFWPVAGLIFLCTGLRLWQTGMLRLEVARARAYRNSQQIHKQHHKHQHKHHDRNKKRSGGGGI